MRAMQSCEEEKNEIDLLVAENQGILLPLSQPWPTSCPVHRRLVELVVNNYGGRRW